MDASIAEKLAELIKIYRLKGELVYYDNLKSGNINDTYTVVTDYGGSERQYLIQRINLNVFKKPLDVAANIASVTQHIESKLKEAGVSDLRRRVVKFYKTPDGDYYHYDSDGSCWRVSSFVFNSVTHDSADNTELLCSVGTAFGEFQKFLCDFDASKLFITIPDFHNTEKRVADMISAAKADPFGRLNSVKSEYDYLISESGCAKMFRELNEKGEIPVRVTHNDTKCNNVMFDSATNRHLAVIDLDTVMPGFVAHDFGDAVRFAANPGGEDADDVSEVFLDLGRYAAFAKGYVTQIRGFLTEKELLTLPDGVAVITLELAARFLTDYLSGDVYFKCKKKNHNLIRTRAQTALLKDIIAKMPLMRTELNKIIANCANN